MYSGSEKLIARLLLMGWDYHSMFRAIQWVLEAYFLQVDL